MLAPLNPTDGHEHKYWGSVLNDAIADDMQATSASATRLTSAILSAAGMEEGRRAEGKEGGVRAMLLYAQCETLCSNAQYQYVSIRHQLHWSPLGLD